MGYKARPALAGLFIIYKPKPVRRCQAGRSGSPASRSANPCYTPQWGRVRRDYLDEGLNGTTKKYFCNTRNGWKRVPKPTKVV